MNDSSLIRNTAHVDSNDENLDNVRFVKVNSMPAVREHLTPKYSVDQAISYNVYETTLLRLNPDEELDLYEQNCIVLTSTLTSSRMEIELPTKSYVDNLHEINRKRRNLSSVFNDQDNEFKNNKLINLDSIRINREPSSDDEPANKNYVDDSIGASNILRFNQTLENYLKISVGKDTYNLTKYDKIQIPDTTVIKTGNGAYLIPRWIVVCNDKNIIGKTTNFIRATKTKRPTSQSTSQKPN